MPVLLVIAWVKLVRLGHRVAALERRPATTTQSRPAQAPPQPSRQAPAASDPPRRPEPGPSTGPPPHRATATPEGPRSPDPVQKLLGTVRDWFTRGNVPVKVGMLVLFAGVAALLKYAADQGWMSLPIELRLAGIAAAAVAGLLFGWRQRRARRVFALSLQGGALGVLLMTVYAAFRLYGLLPAEPAFGLALVLVAAAGVLAVAQNALALAVLGLLAGYASPVLMSTGEGSHVILFSYYTLLNLAVLGIARYRAWRILNLLGFAFTFGIGVAWGVLRYTPEHYASVQPFLIGFFLIYLAIPILDRRGQRPGRRDLVDGSLVFGNPLIAFSLQAVLMEGRGLPLAFCALGLGGLYAGLAAWQLRGGRGKLLGQSFALLGLGFATLAVPLALSARVTASVFALEGAALVWLGLRQRRRLPEFIGLALQGLAAFSFIAGQGFGVQDLRVVANPACMGALLLAVAGFASAASYHFAGRRARAPVMYAWALAWWAAMGVFEIHRFVPVAFRPDALLGFAALTLILAGAARLRLSIPALGRTIAAALAVAILLALWQYDLRPAPLAGTGLWAWPVYLAAGFWALRSLRGDAEAGWAHGAWIWALTIAAGLSLAGWLPETGLAGGWSLAGLMLAGWLAAAGVLWRPGWVTPPLGADFAGWRKPLAASLITVLAVVAAAGLFHPGDSAPLMWLPLFNPLELVLIATLLLGHAGLARAPALAARRVLVSAIAGFVLVSDFTLRAVHQLGGEAWSPALLSTTLAQTSLTLVWSALGVAGWIAGSRRGQRMLWLAGAVLMGVVLAKLLLIDRQDLGNLLGIISFIAYGLLCTAVGYFAPAPPKTREHGEPA